MLDPCEKERSELENAQRQLNNHIQNPLDWDTSSEEYQNKLTELRRIVREKEVAFEECKAKK